MSTKEARRQELLRQAAQSRANAVTGERRCLACGRPFPSLERLAQHLQDAHEGVNCPPAPGAAPAASSHQLLQFTLGDVPVRAGPRSRAAQQADQAQQAQRPHGVRLRGPLGMRGPAAVELGVGRAPGRQQQPSLAPPRPQHAQQRQQAAQQQHPQQAQQQRPPALNWAQALQLPRQLPSQVSPQLQQSRQQPQRAFQGGSAAPAKPVSQAAVRPAARPAMLNGGTLAASLAGALPARAPVAPWAAKATHAPALGQQALQAQQAQRPGSRNTIQAAGSRDVKTPTTRAASGTPPSAAGPTAAPCPPPGTRAKAKKRPSRLRRAFRRSAAVQAVERWLGVLSEFEEALQATGEMLGAALNELQALQERSSVEHGSSNMPAEALTRAQLLEAVLERGRLQEEELCRAHWDGRQRLERAQAALLALGAGPPTATQAAAGAANTAPGAAGSAAALEAAGAEGSGSEPVLRAAFGRLPASVELSLERQVQQQPRLAPSGAPALERAQLQPSQALPRAAAVGQAEPALVAASGSARQGVPEPGVGRLRKEGAAAAAAAAAPPPQPAEPALASQPLTQAQRSRHSSRGAGSGSNVGRDGGIACSGGSGSGSGSCASGASESDLGLNWGDTLAAWMPAQLQSVPARVAPQRKQAQQAQLTQQAQQAGVARAAAPANATAAAGGRSIGAGPTVATAAAVPEAVHTAAPAATAAAAAAEPPQPQAQGELQGQQPRQLQPTQQLPPPTPSSANSSPSSSSSSVSMQWGDTLAGWMPAQLTAPQRPPSSQAQRQVLLVSEGVPAPRGSSAAAAQASPSGRPAGREQLQRSQAAASAAAPPAAAAAAAGGEAGAAAAAAAAVGSEAAAGGGVQAAGTGRQVSSAVHSDGTGSDPLRSQRQPAAVEATSRQPLQEQNPRSSGGGSSGSGGSNGGSNGSSSASSGGSSSSSELSMEWGDTLRAWASSMKTQAQGLLHSLNQSSGTQRGQQAQGGRQLQGGEQTQCTQRGGQQGIRLGGQESGGQESVRQGSGQGSGRAVPLPAAPVILPAAARLAASGQPPAAQAQQPSAQQEQARRASSVGLGLAAAHGPLPTPHSPAAADRAATEAVQQVQQWLSSSEPVPPEGEAMGMEGCGYAGAEQLLPQPLQQAQRQLESAEAAGGLGDGQPVQQQGDKPLPKGATLCTVCQVVVSGEANYRQHLESRKHAKRVEQLAAQSVAQQGPGAAAAATAAQAAPQPKEYVGAAAADVAPYVDQVIEPELNEVALQLLQQLLAWQERVRLNDPVNFKRKRRLVSGMREVGKCVKTKKAKAVLVAPNINAIQGEDGAEYPITSLLQLAAENGIPVVFALSRQRMGKVLGPASGKKASAFAILDFDGANQQFKRLLQLAEQGRAQWREAQTEAQAQAGGAPLAGNGAAVG